MSASLTHKPNNLFEIISPSCTGLGLEVLRTAPLIRAALRTGWRPRLWTFHPGAFDGSQIEIVPLQQGWEPLLPFAENHVRFRGVVWLPHAHPQGPYVCNRSLAEGIEHGCELLVTQSMSCEPGAYPAFVREIAFRIFGEDGAPGDDIDPLYPADSEVGTSTPIVLNLVGAHGIVKGLSDVGTVCSVANRLAGSFIDQKWLVLLNARVCAGQRAIMSGRNIRTLVHLDSDAMVARCISRNALVITIEGGLAHFSIHRGLQPVVVGVQSWLDETAYLYPTDSCFRRCEVATFDANTLVETIGNLLVT